MFRLTDCPHMTSAVYHGHMQQIKSILLSLSFSNKICKINSKEMVYLVCPFGFDVILYISLLLVFIERRVTHFFSN